MIYVKKLSAEETLTLENMHQHHPCHASRIRAHGVLLSDAGFTVKELSEVFGVCRQTTATWLQAWERGGVCALFDKPRSGRPCLLSTEAHRQEAVERVTQSPRSLKKVAAQLAESLGINLSCSTLKRLCKQAKLCWKRVRKSLKSKRDPERFSQSQQQLAALTEQAALKEMDLVYFDQSGFTLEPCIPYAWQPVGATIEVPCAKSKRLNVLGFMGRDCSFQSWVFEGSVTSAVVVACIDRFAQSLKRPTALVLDNAPIHTSHELVDCSGRWQQLGLTLLPIAPYSPELNLIEILWRKIKYEWMSFSAYESFSALKQNLFDILANIGKSYCIKFA